MADERPKSPALMAVLLLMLTGCTVSGIARTSAPGVCDAEAAQRLVGRSKPDDAEAGRLTGATIVRQIAPGQPVTQDYRTNRVTIETDPATGRVVRAQCG